MSFATGEGRRSVVDWPCSLVFAYFGGASFVHCHFGEVSCAFLSSFFCCPVHTFYHYRLHHSCKWDLNDTYWRSNTSYSVHSLDTPDKWQLYTYSGRAGGTCSSSCCSAIYTVVCMYVHAHTSLSMDILLARRQQSLGVPYQSGTSAQEHCESTVDERREAITVEVWTREISTPLLTAAWDYSKGQRWVSYPSAVDST